MMDDPQNGPASDEQTGAPAPAPAPETAPAPEASDEQAAA